MSAAFRKGCHNWSYFIMQTRITRISFRYMSGIALLPHPENMMSEEHESQCCGCRSNLGDQAHHMSEQFGAASPVLNMNLACAASSSFREKLYWSLEGHLLIGAFVHGILPSRTSQRSKGRYHQISPLSRLLQTIGTIRIQDGISQIL